MIAFNPRQREAIAFPCNTAVNASAGTGKTATLVGAYLGLLERGVLPGQILAITFTDKAAAEMRDRLKREVLGRAMLAPDEATPAVDWRRVLTQLSNAPISTIHAFCAALLKENPVEAGVDPQFTIWDDDESGAVRREAILTRIRAHICSGHPGVQALFRDLQLQQTARHGPKHLAEVVEAALRWLNGLGVDLRRRDPQGRNWLEDRFLAQQAALAALRARFDQGLAEVRQAFHALATLPQVRGKNAQHCVQRIREHLADIEAALSRVGFEAPAETARACEALAGYLKAGNLGQHPADAPVRSSLATLRRWLGDDAPAGGLKALGAAATGLELTRHLIALVSDVQAEYARRKTLARSLDFDDLLTQARNLLKFQAAVRRRYKERFRAVLVDEFQDTDELQGEIIALLAEARGVERLFHPFDRYRTLLEHIGLDPHRLFIVGDAKQSIYRFRRADVSVFVAMAEKIAAAGGRVVALVENYRSGPAILAFVNTLFRRVMDGGTRALPPHVDTRHRIRYAAGDHLVPGGQADQPGRVIVVVGGAEQAAEGGRALEARALAALIEELHAGGALASYRDVAILLKAHTHAQLYEEALRERGLPHYRVKGGGFFQRQEIADLAAFVSYIVDPGDDLALAEVLTSPLVGLDYADLYRLCEGREAGAPLVGCLTPARLAALPEALRQRLAGFVDWATRLLRLRDRLEPAELLEYALGATHYEAVLMAQPDGEQRVANVAKLLDLARGFSRRGIAGLHDFAAYLRERLDEETSRRPEAQILSEDEDVVRLMTIHQAKGLEFPAAVIPDLAHEGGGERGARVLFDERWGLMCAAAYGVDRARLLHPLMLEAEMVERDKELEEQKRLLYVALTRPQHILVLGTGASQRPGPWYRWIMDALTATPENAEALEQVRAGARSTALVQLDDVAVELRYAAALARRPTAQVGPTLAPPAPTPAELETLQRRVWGWQPPRPHTVELSPTALGTLAKCLRYFFLHELAGLDEQPPGQEGGLPAVDKGRIVHGVLERVEIDLPADAIAARVRQLLRQESGAFLLGPDDFETLAQDLERYLRSPTWQGLRHQPTLQREVPFSLCLRGEGLELLIRGRIDALVVHAGRPVVIDHKYALYDRHKEAGYEIPMAVYALAAMQALGAAQAEVQLSFLRSSVYPTERRTISVADRVEEQLLRLARAYVERRHASDLDAWPRIPRAQCELARCGFRAFCWQGEGAAS
jgi:ATP-dependent helicase/nuclease subunit A